MRRTIVIGYGNPLRGDDALGWRVTERLRELVQSPEIEILTLHQLMPELMEPLSEAELAIFVDACEGPEPGRIAERTVEARLAPGAAFTHQATPEGLLAGARVLYGRAAEGVMFSIAAADFSLGAELSPAVSARVEELVERIRRRVVQ
jgi:hydrogenase maturation protease